MPTAAVIVPTTGAPEVSRAIASVLAQSHTEAVPYVVVDGKPFEERFRSVTAALDLGRAQVCVLPANTGRNEFNGHRVYAAFSHLVDADYVLFLDEDNWFDREHVALMIRTIEESGLDWCHSLRRICAKDGAFLFNDDCESLGRWPGWTGRHLVDTNAYCLTRELATRAAGAWHGKRGQDRVFYALLSKHFPNFHCTGRYTVNYRLGGNAGSAIRGFFEQGNLTMRQRFPAGLPWQVEPDQDTGFSAVA